MQFPAATGSRPESITEEQILAELDLRRPVAKVTSPEEDESISQKKKEAYLDLAAQMDALAQQEEEEERRHQQEGTGSHLGSACVMATCMICLASSSHQCTRSRGFHPFIFIFIRNFSLLILLHF